MADNEWYFTRVFITLLADNKGYFTFFITFVADNKG